MSIKKLMEFLMLGAIIVALLKLKSSDEEDAKTEHRKNYKYGNEVPQESLTSKILSLKSRLKQEIKDCLSKNGIGIKDIEEKGLFSLVIKAKIDFLNQLNEIISSPLTAEEKKQKILQFYEETEYVSSLSPCIFSDYKMLIDNDEIPLDIKQYIKKFGIKAEELEKDFSSVLNRIALLLYKQGIEEEKESFNIQKALLEMAENDEIQQCIDEISSKIKKRLEKLSS